MTTLNLNIPQIQRIAELLIGAAHADADYDGHEAEMIGDILRELVTGHTLPGELTSHLARFDVEELDVEAAAFSLRLLDDAARHSILNLVVRVVDADGVHDMAESEYIHRVALALDVDESDYEDFVVEIIELEPITPPPVPGSY